MSGIGKLKAGSVSIWRAMLLGIILATLCPDSSHAHDVIVQQDTKLLEEPDSNSNAILVLVPGDVVKLLENLPVDGYYHVFHKNGNGWISHHNVVIRQEYERGDWRHWTDADKNGLDTRAEVLSEESIVDVTLSADGRRVKFGEWRDPYTGQTFRNAMDVDVDHMVPLQNAHASGGWLWDWERRRKYANDLEHPEHLIVVSDRANSSKGASGPDRWKPPDEKYWCQYARHWERIKQRWNLSMTDKEQDAVEEMKRKCP